MISRFIEEKKYCERWVSTEEAKKMKLINERVLIETWLGRILILLNYFVVRQLVLITGERFMPNFEKLSLQYIVTLTWVVFAIIVFISIIQLVTKNKVYLSDMTLSGERVSYYKYRILNRAFRVFILVLLYITLYQILFQITIDTIDIKKTILIWILVVNSLILIYLAFIVSKNSIKGTILVTSLEGILENEHYDLVEIKEKLAEIKGELNSLNSIDLRITYKAIDDLISIAEKTGAVEEKSCISKTELITNVSHDLKTPLTSVINYVNFLNKDNITLEQRAEFIDILERKTKSLKSLVEDLKDSLGTESGEINVELEKVKIDEILEGALFEFKERIYESTLEFVIEGNFKEIKQSSVDKNKMLRVFHNLLSNILKYSEDNSKVIIKVSQEESVDFSAGYYTRIQFKNTSDNQINIKGEELLERFKRGDASRNTEGSGLGLDIANSLLKLQGGELKISIDGLSFNVDVII